MSWLSASQSRGTDNDAKRPGGVAQRPYAVFRRSLRTSRKAVEQPLARRAEALRPQPMQLLLQIRPLLRELAGLRPGVSHGCATSRGLPSRCRFDGCKMGRCYNERHIPSGTRQKFRAENFFRQGDIGPHRLFQQSVRSGHLSTPAAIINKGRYSAPRCGYHGSAVTVSGIVGPSPGLENRAAGVPGNASPPAARWTQRGRIGAQSTFKVQGPPDVQRWPQACFRT